jgi:hypothetical protein
MCPLKDILVRLPTQKMRKIGGLLPHIWAPLRNLMPARFRRGQRESQSKHRDKNAAPKNHK